MGQRIYNLRPCSMGACCTSLSIRVNHKPPGMAFVWLELPSRASFTNPVGLNRDFMPRLLSCLA